MEIIQIFPFTSQTRKGGPKNSFSLNSNMWVDNGFIHKGWSGQEGAISKMKMWFLYEEHTFPSLKYINRFWMNSSRKYFYITYLWNINYHWKWSQIRLYGQSEWNNDYTIFFPQLISNKPPTQHVTTSNTTRRTFQNVTIT